MKKLLKGFTLIELIVVMAILSILVTGIMQMFKPIRETYIDSALTESRRNTQTGVVTYIAESLRFATDVGIYNSMTVDTAVEKFAEGYADKAGCPGDTTVKDLIKANVQIIVIDNEKDYEYGGFNGLRGRLLRRTANSLGNAGAISLAVESNYRMAMGTAYYGGNKYSITLTADKADPSAGIGITVASSARYSLARELKDDTVKTNGHVVCRNLEAPINGFYDVDIFGSPSGTTSAGNNTYIVFFNERPDGLPDA